MLTFSGSKFSMTFVAGFACVTMRHRPAASGTIWKNMIQRESLTLGPNCAACRNNLLDCMGDAFSVRDIAKGRTGVSQVRTKITTASVPDVFLLSPDKS